jgi:hypothetical protein
MRFSLSCDAKITPFHRLLALLLQQISKLNLKTTNDETETFPTNACLDGYPLGGQC